MIPVILAVAGVLSALASVDTLVNTPQIAAAASDAASASDAPAAADSGTATANFSDTLKAAVNRVDDTVATADHKAKTFASGDQNVSLSDVMVSLEQASLALQAAAAVRDKVVAAYSNVMNMQV
jgi:flagellar hook-basal body complex protein FliE